MDLDRDRQLYLFGSDVDDDSDTQSAEDSESEEEHSDYESEEESEPETDLGDIDVGDASIFVTEPELAREVEQDADAGEEYIPDFANLSESERLLPLVDVVSPFEQWTFILEACTSNFARAKHLSKVNNKILELVADAAGVVNAKARQQRVDPHYVEVSNAFIKYARKRNV